MSVRCSFGEECAINKFGIAQCQCPSNCEPIMRPVCSKDDRTFPSECEMKRAACLGKTAIEITYTGICGEKGMCIFVFDKFAVKNYYQFFLVFRITFMQKYTILLFTYYDFTMISRIKKHLVASCHCILSISVPVSNSSSHEEHLIFDLLPVFSIEITSRSTIVFNVIYQKRCKIQFFYIANIDTR